jgi:uncharacterized protein YjiS (DUF1127 family)
METTMTGQEAIWGIGRDRKTGTRGQLGAWGSRMLDRLDTWIERHRQRNSLLELNDALLKDIGISRADAVGESRKPFWRA